MNQICRAWLQIEFTNDISQLPKKDHGIFLLQLVFARVSNPSTDKI